MVKRLRAFGRRAGFALTKILLVCAVPIVLAGYVNVLSGSMEYTVLPGDRVLVSRAIYGLPLLEGVLGGPGPWRGEVVIFASPQDGTTMIKRVVAVGGDEVMVRGGHLVVNGEPLAQPDDGSVEVFHHRLVRLNLTNGGGADLGPVEVPGGHVLVLGDYRGNSMDGRIFGFVPVTTISGHAIAVFHRRGQGFVWKPL